jgi:hypothetical protein
VEAAGRGGLVATEGQAEEEGQADMMDPEGVEDQAVMEDMVMEGITGSCPDCSSEVS